MFRGTIGAYWPIIWMMAIVLRIALTPLAFALVARAQARFGDWIGGRLIGLPLTTGPFLLTVCLTSSRSTAAHAAAGVTSGQMAVVAFCSAYAWTARRLRPLPATITSLAVALTAVLALSSVAGPWSAAAAVWCAIAVSLVVWPWDRSQAEPDPAPGAATAAATPAATMLQRAAIATAVVATMSSLVPILGARPAGIISSAPILLSIILPGTHRQSGPSGAAVMARGTIVSMAATVAFSASLASTLAWLSVPAALAVSAAVLGALVALTPLLDRVGSRGQSALAPRPCSSAPFTPASSAFRR